MISAFHQAIVFKMRKYLLLAVLNSMTALLSGQSLTLAEAIALSEQNRPELKSATLEVRLAERQNEHLRAEWRPSVSLSGDLRWNTQLQTSVLPIGEFGLPNVPADEVREFRIGTPFNHSFSLQADQKIFDGTRKTNQIINDLDTEAARNRQEISRVDIRQAVEKAYYAAVFYREQTRLAAQSVENVAARVDMLKTRIAGGTAIRDDLDRALLDLDNAKYALEKSKRNLAVSLENLRYQTGSDQAVEPAEDLRSVRQAFLESDPGAEATVRPELESEAINFQVLAWKEKLEKQRNLPVVSAYGNYSVVQLHDQPNPFAAGTWFPYSYIGIRASMPLYDGRQSRLRQEDLRLQQMISQTETARLSAAFANELANARTNFDLAGQTLEQTEKSLDLARQLFDTDQVRFRQGTRLLSELKDTENRVREAEENYLQSLFDFLVAGLQLKRAAGK